MDNTDVAAKLQMFREGKNYSLAIDFISKNQSLINSDKSLGEAIAICILTREYKLADSLIDQALSVGGDVPSIVKRKADIQHRLGNKDAALYWAKKYHELEGSIASSAVYASYLKRLKKPVDALAVLGSQTKDKLRNEQWVAECADNLIREQDLDGLKSLLSCVSYESLKKYNSKVLYISAAVYINNEKGGDLESLLGGRAVETIPRQELSLALSKAISSADILEEAGKVELDQFLSPEARIVQYWDNFSTMTDDVKSATSEWKNIAGDRYDLFDKARAVTFIMENFGSFAVRAFQSSLHPAQEADIFRLAYLAVKGGIYVDVDFLPKSTLMNLLLNPNKKVAFYYRDNLPPHQRELLNSFIVAKSGSAFLYESFFKSINKISNATREGIWRDTGPGLIGEQYLISRYSLEVDLPLHEDLFKKCLVHKQNWDYKETLQGWQAADVIV
jgi:hypothetical protein